MDDATRHKYEISISDPGPLDPDGQHAVRFKQVFNDEQASTQVIVLDDAELYSLFASVAVRMGINR